MGINISKMLGRAKTYYDDIMNQLLENNESSSNVTLYYPSTFEDCTNCEFTDWGVSHRSGGPQPFTLGGCPQCGSSNSKYEVETSEVIRLRIYSVDPTSFSRHKFKEMGISLQQPQGELLTIGYLDDLRKVKSCNYAVMFSDQESSTGSLRYNLSSEPLPHGFGKDTYFYCFWKRGGA